MKNIPVISKTVKTGASMLVLGAILGGIFTFLLSRTVWTGLQIDFFFWASIVMTIISLVLAGVSVWQYLAADAERKKGDAQVKIWMQDANGIHDGLRNIAINCLLVGDNDNRTHKYSTVNDVGMAVYAFSSSAKALHQSLYEERCVTEEEYTKRQKEIGDAMHQQQLKKIRTEGEIG